MSHVFEKPSLVIETALKQLRREMIIQNYVLTNALGDFGGSKNDTINVRIPAILQSRTREFRGTGAQRNVVADDLVEHVFPVTLDNVIYNAVFLTDEQLTLDIRDFYEQVISPQVTGVAYGIEDYLAALIEEANYTLPTQFISAADTFPSFIDSRRALNDENVPNSDRVRLVGSAVEAVLLKDPQFRRYDAAGASNSSALRNAVIGDVAGMPVVRSNALLPDFAYEFHRSAFIFVNRAPKKPFSTAVNAAATYSAGGAAFRWLADYDFTNLTDRSLLDTYVGSRQVNEVDGRFVRALRLQLAATGVTVVGGENQTLASATGTKQLQVLDSNGVDRTAEATYVSATPAKATVGAGTGLVTGVAAGTTVITASYNPPQGGAAVTDTQTITVPA